VIYQGSCHCRAITFEVEASENIEADRCNCSICSRNAGVGSCNQAFCCGKARTWLPAQVLSLRCAFRQK
jgi:hypothetical protein